MLDSVCSSVIGEMWASFSKRHFCKICGGSREFWGASLLSISIKKRNRNKLYNSCERTSSIGYWMLCWASLFICCVVALRLAAAIEEVTCDTLKSGAPMAISRGPNGSLTATTLLLEKCRWANVGIRLLADGPFVVVLRDVQLVGGSLTIAVSGGLEEATVGSALILQSSTLINCSKCLCVSSASAPLFHVDLVVAHSTIEANESAATLDAPYIRDSSIRVTDSTVEVHSVANAVVASANAPHADNVLIEVINSTVDATTTNGVA